MNWVTKDKQVIPIKDLTDDHLKNIVKMLKRKGWVHSDTWEQCLAYTCYGDTPYHAAVAAEAELDAMRFSEESDAVFEEFDRRGLK